MMGLNLVQLTRLKTRREPLPVMWRRRHPGYPHAAVMADINDELLRLQNELDELSKQEELLATRKQADDLR